MTNMSSLIDGSLAMGGLLATVAAAVWTLRASESSAPVETTVTVGILVPPLTHAA